MINYIFFNIGSVYPRVERLVESSPLEKMFNNTLFMLRTILSISNSVMGYTVTLTSS